MTLLETMFAVGIFVVVIGMLMVMWLSFSDTADVQNAQVTTTNEARQALLRLVPDLHGALAATVNWGELPGEVLTYRVATDNDGNGLAVDSDINIEMSGIHTVQRDTNDINGDGRGADQLVLIDASTEPPTVTVLANGVLEANEDAGEDGILGPLEDTNGNGRLDQGFFVEARGRGLVITIGAEHGTRKGHDIISSMTEYVVPRN